MFETRRIERRPMRGGVQSRCSTGLTAWRNALGGACVRGARHSVGRARTFMWPIVWVLAVTVSLGIAGPTTAALQKPTYSTGDHWIYITTASISSFPGLNSSQGSGQFGLVGQVEVRVIGPAEVPRGNTSVQTVQVLTRAAGILNGRFRAPRFGPADCTGHSTPDLIE